MEKRKHARMEFRTEAVLRHCGLTFRGDVENLSLKGLFVRTGHRIALNEPVDVSLFFYGNSGEMSFSIKANVTRVTDEGIGLGFGRIDMDSLLHQEYPLVASSENPNETVVEFCDYLERKEPSED